MRKKLFKSWVIILSFLLLASVSLLYSERDEPGPMGSNTSVEIYIM